MDNGKIARLLRSVAAAYTLSGENRFRIIAYERAADSIEHATGEAKDLWEQNKLQNLPGVGSAIAGYLNELFRTGKVKHFTQVMRRYPDVFYELLDVPGFGPKKAYKLVTELRLNQSKKPIVDLKQAAIDGRIAKIEGFGVKSAELILQQLKEYTQARAKGRRMVLPYASELAEKILTYLKKSSAVLAAEPLGSLRRMAATVGDIDIAVATLDPAEVIDWFCKYRGVQRVIEKGPASSSILVTGGKQVDLMVQPPESFGSLLQHFTGSKEHNIALREYAQKKDLSLSEHGIKIKNTGRIEKHSSEESFYKALGMDWIAPELREGKGEIDASLKHVLPDLVSLKDIRGDLHIHTNYNLEPSHDLGKSSIEDIYHRACALGYDYIGISDHNPSVNNHSADKILAILSKRKKYFDQIIYSKKFTRTKIFLMLEIDILPTGELAIPDSGFNFIDAAIASIHSGFSFSRERMTERVLAGLSHPKVKILGHPTGRLLEKREGYDLDWPEVFRFCKEHNKAIEINAYPERLDLPDSLVKLAVEAGVPLVVNTDSHHIDQMSLMQFGISVARRGWATKHAIINTLPYNSFKDWLFA